MKLFRKVLGVIVLLLGLMFAATAAAAAAQKLGQLPAIAMLTPYVPKFNAAPWWQVAVCAVAGLFWLVSAGSLLRNTRQAFMPYAGAFIATAVLWWFICQAPKYGMTFAPEGRMLEIRFWGGLVVLGLLVALSDRRKRYRPDAE